MVESSAIKADDLVDLIECGLRDVSVGLGEHHTEIGTPHLELETTLLVLKGGLSDGRARFSRLNAKVPAASEFNLLVNPQRQLLVVAKRRTRGFKERVVAGLKRKGRVRPELRVDAPGFSDLDRVLRSGERGVSLLRQAKRLVQTQSRRNNEILSKDGANRRSEEQQKQRYTSHGELQKTAGRHTYRQSRTTHDRPREDHAIS